MQNKFDVIVLGTGNTGIAAASIAREAGKSVAVVENRDVGGTCAIRGCVPKKVLVAAAQVMHQIDLAKTHHIETGPVKLDWGKLIERERTFVDGVPDEFKGMLQKRGIVLIDGEARFEGANKISVGDQLFEADKIVIATGSSPRQLPIPGWDLTITSDDILEMDELPKSLIFIGGGVIALEFSHVFARAGTKVTILEAMPHLLPRLETEVVDALRRETERLGIKILTDVKVKEINKSDDNVSVTYEHGGETITNKANHIANGTGRVANTANLNLEAANIETKGGRILVTEHLRSESNADVYVGGDALWSSAQLSPIASYEGRIIGKNIVNGDKVSPDYSSIPSAVYTVPAFASVGMTTDEANEKGLDFEVKANDMRTWRSSRTYAETVAFSKVLVDKKSNQILGAHMVGHGAEEIIHLLSFAMENGTTAKQLTEKVYAYPTFASDLKFLV